MSWLGLLRHGLKLLVDEPIDMDENEKLELASHQSTLNSQSSTTEHLLQAASFLKRKLVASQLLDEWFDAEFDDIYEEFINKESNSILDAIGALYKARARIITTNYDDLLEKHLDAESIIPNDTVQLQLFFRRRKEGICHVHGAFRESKGAILDSTDYDNVVDNEKLQQNLKNSMTSSEVLLFVGAGAGLDDPNFGRLLAWAGKQNEGIACRHYLLARDDDNIGTKPYGLNVLRYGAEFKDLPTFLAVLAKKEKGTDGCPSTRLPILNVHLLKDQSNQSNFPPFCLIPRTRLNTLSIVKRHWTRFANAFVKMILPPEWLFSLGWEVVERHNWLSDIAEKLKTAANITRFSGSMPRSLPQSSKDSWIS